MIYRLVTFFALFILVLPTGIVIEKLTSLAVGGDMSSLLSIRGFFFTSLIFIFPAMLLVELTRWMINLRIGAKGLPYFLLSWVMLFVTMTTLAFLYEQIRF